MAGLSKAIEGQALPLLPDALAKQLRQLDNPPLALRVRLGDDVAGQGQRDRRQKQTSKERIELIRAAGDVDLSRLKATLLGLVQSESDAEVVTAALLVLQRIDDPELGQAVARRLTDLPAAARSTAISSLASRARGWPTAGRCRVQALGQAQHRDHRGSARPRQQGGRPDKSRLAKRRSTGNGTAAEIARVRSVVEGRTQPVRGRILPPTLRRLSQIIPQGRRHSQSHRLPADRPRHPAARNPRSKPGDSRGLRAQQVQIRDGRRLSGFLSDQTNHLLILRGIDGSDTVVEQAQVMTRIRREA